MNMPGAIDSDYDSDEADEIRDFTAELGAGISVNAINDSGDTRLMVAAVNDYYYLALILLEQHGADPNIGDGEGYRPLHYTEDARIVQLLLEHGAEIDAKNDMGETALTMAIRSPDADWARLLTAVEAAGSWKRYAREPVVQLLCLRHLCLAGRATAPPNLVRCFGSPPVPNAGEARTRRRRAAGSTPLPDEVFAHILGFWHWRT
jgi:hypothetical protein